LDVLADDRLYSAGGRPDCISTACSMLLLRSTGSM
jgi:hypothetical protein